MLMRFPRQTNDLTTLALTCSTLHAIAIPLMYSRFDIVWPDTSVSSEHPAGVDSLSYGLATLVMGEHVFREQPPPRACKQFGTGVCGSCGCNCRRGKGNGIQRMRRGNYYAQYTRKFSVGNGPYAWVQEYSIAKETGKMLGTLVALAVARMVNLESFVWDMPTGVLREIWLALSSLAERDECRLERVWVRWHDNSNNPRRTSISCLPGQQGNSSSVLDKFTPAELFRCRYSHVEYPTLSVLPPLKSLSVLDIDEASYLEEMAVLIERSRDQLRELRIGMALKAFQASWLQPSEERDQPDAVNLLRLGWPRPGGVLGILNQSEHYSKQKEVYQEPETTEADNTTPLEQQYIQQNDAIGMDNNAQVDQIANDRPQKVHTDSSASKPSRKPVPSNGGSSTKPNRPRLKLETLELERISLSIPTMLRAFDWTRLTTLTILRCEKHEKLWRALARQHSPLKTSTTSGKPSQRSEHDRLEYPLRIKNLHTDAVSPNLILFLKETIAPNSLESIFLQESPGYYSVVHIDKIFQHVLQRHRLSLKKVLLDSTERSSSGKDMATTAWRKWLANRKILSFIASGCMPRLRELGIAMHSKDWVSCLVQFGFLRMLKAEVLTYSFSTFSFRDCQVCHSSESCIFHISVNQSTVTQRNSHSRFWTLSVFVPR